MKHQKSDFGAHVYITSPKYTARDSSPRFSSHGWENVLQKNKKISKFGVQPRSVQNAAEGRRAFGENRDQNAAICVFGWVCEGDGGQRNKGDIVVFSHFRAFWDCLRLLVSS